MADATLSDRLVVEIAADLSPMSQSLSQAGQQLSYFATGSVGAAARDMTGAFSATFGALEKSVVKAARTGELSIRGMVDAMLTDLARVAVRSTVIEPIESAARGLAGAIVSALGARALGGPVAAGGAYLVGERGPELFVPSTNGNIVAGDAVARARPQIIVNVQTPNAQSFMKSESQVAAMMTRALIRGQRNL